MEARLFLVYYHHSTLHRIVGGNGCSHGNTPKMIGFLGGTVRLPGWSEYRDGFQPNASLSARLRKPNSSGFDRPTNSVRRPLDWLVTAIDYVILFTVFYC